MNNKLNLEEICENNKNKFHITCTICSCLILRSKDGNLINKEIELPLLPKKVTDKTNDDKTDNKATGKEECKKTKILDKSLTEKELLTHYWVVDDIFTFENLGFSKDVGEVKYLICGACEYGPIGIHEINNKKSYISLQRINYQTEKK